MSGGYEVILNNLKLFSGSGLLVLLFAVSLVFLYIRRRTERDRDILVLYPIAMLLIYFCPMWILYSAKRNDSEILYRILWLVPMGIVICAALVELINMLPKEKRVLGVVASLVLIFMCGKYIYSNTQFTRAQNIYHVPQDVVEICNIIETPGREVRACVPDELLQYIRQYDSYIHLSYGRDVLLSGDSQNISDLRTLVTAEELDAEAIAEKLREEKTPYFVIPRDRILDHSMEDYGFNYVAGVGEYDIYLDAHANVSLIYED